MSRHDPMLLPDGPRFADAGYAMPYMEWAKTVLESGDRRVIDAGSSGIAPVTLRELGVRLKDLALDGPHGYSAATALHRAVARHVGTGEECVLTALGASHALYLVCASLLRPGDVALVETPGYEALTLVPRSFGARIVPLPRRFENGFQIDPDELHGLVTPRTRLILVTNLHNPSGVALSREALAALASHAGGRTPVRRPARRGASRTAGRGSSGRDRHAPGARARARLDEGPWVVLNEVYRDFVRRGPPPPGHTLGPRGVSISSLTKVYGLGYTRVGWIAGDAALIHRASRVNDFGVVNTPYIADTIGALALARRRKLLARTMGILDANRKIFARFLEESAPRLDIVPPSGGLIAFPRVRGLRDGRDFVARAIREHGVCVVPGEFFGAPGHIRIGIGTRRSADLAEGLRRLTRALRAVADD